MDLRQLRYFVTIAERGSFSAAASALNIAQSALSRHVKDLEDELGGDLLERGARGVVPTESGKLLLERGRWLLGTLGDIREEVRTENREPSGTVRIGAPASLAELFYAPLAQVFATRFPRVRLELSEGLTDVMCDRLLRGDVDIAIVTSPPPNRHLAYEKLVTEQVFLFGPPGDPLLQSGKLTRKAFEGLSNAIAPFGRSLFPANVPASVLVEGSTPLKQIAALGIGYGILPSSGIQQEVRQGRLSAALLPWMGADRVAALPRGRRTSRATQEALEVIKDICAALIKDGAILPLPSPKRTGRKTLGHDGIHSSHS